MLESNRNKASAQQAAHHAIGIASGQQNEIEPANAALILNKVTAPSGKIVNPDTSIRDVEDDDAAGLAQIIAAIMGEFPGCVFDLDADFPELKRPKSSFARDGGRLWVVESSAISAGKRGDNSSPAVTEIVGCFGFLPAEDPETGPKQPLAAGKVHRLHDRHRRPQKIGLALRQENQLSAGGVGVPVGANLDRPT